MSQEKLLDIAPADLIELDGWNVRLPDDPDNLAHIEALAESICHVGVLEPLTAYCEKVKAEGEAVPVERHVVTNGHMRLAAVKIAIARGAPIKTLKVRLEPKHANPADRVFSMVGRNSGKSLSSLELGNACKRLLAFGWSEADIAKKSGYSQQHVHNVVALASSGETITRLVETGQVSPTLAVQAIAAEGAEQAGETLKEAVQEAHAEEAAKPASKKPKKSLVKATLKHVTKAKGKKALANTGKKHQVEAGDNVVDRLRAMPVMQALAVFDQLKKNRAETFENLMLYTKSWLNHIDEPNFDAPENRGNGRDPDLETLALLFGRVAVDTPDADGIIVIAMNADEWETACKLLAIKQIEPADA